MRLDEYLPLEIGRLTTHVRAALEAGDEATAWRLLRAKLTLMERVLEDQNCPPLTAPESVGDARWDAMLSGALLGILGIIGPQWPAPEPLDESWFPMAETDDERAWLVVKTPPELAACGVFIRLRDLRWTAGPQAWADPDPDDDGLEVFSGTQAKAGVQVRARRRELGLTQAELGKLAAVSRAFVSAAERGQAGGEFGKLTDLMAAVGMKLVPPETVRLPSSPSISPNTSPG